MAHGPVSHGPVNQRAARAVMTVLRLYRALERVSPDLTPQQYRILKLAGAGGERSARLAERLAVARPTLTAIADGLVAAGYARRDPEPGDRRVVRLCLTPSGCAALARADQAYVRWLDQLLAQAGDHDLVLDALDLLGQAMDARWSAAPAQDRTAQDVGAQDRTAQDRRAQDVGAQDGTLKDRTAQDRTAQDVGAQGASADDAAREDRAQQEPGGTRRPRRERKLPQSPAAAGLS